jgi:hypothetical protein
MARKPRKVVSEVKEEVAEKLAPPTTTAETETPKDNNKPTLGKPIVRN